MYALAAHITYVHMHIHMYDACTHPIHARMHRCMHAIACPGVVSLTSQMSTYEEPILLKPANLIACGSAATYLDEQARRARRARLLTLLGLALALGLPLAAAAMAARPV